ncbi:MAG: MOSC domain-containing protein [Tabrizicola sp.]
MTKGPDTPVTEAELAEALPSVLAAPRDAGEVRLLCARPEPNARTFPPVLTLTRAAGVVGDFEMSRPWLTLPDGSPDPQNQVSIMPWRVLDLVWRQRDVVTHPGDNIAVDMNLTEENLPVGTLLSAGTAVLRVSAEPNDGCVKWKVRYGPAAYAWIIRKDHLPLRLRGLYCSVEQDGALRLGDQLRRL